MGEVSSALAGAKEEGSQPSLLLHGRGGSKVSPVAHEEPQKAPGMSAVPAQPPGPEVSLTMMSLSPASSVELIPFSGARSPCPAVLLTAVVDPCCSASQALLS